MKSLRTTVFGFVLALAMVPTPTFAQFTLPDLSALAPYNIFGGSSVTSFGLSQLFGNLAVSPGNLFSLLPPGVLSGLAHLNDDAAKIAKAALETIFMQFMEMSCDNTLLQSNGDMTLSAGSYCQTNGLQLRGNITFDAGGNPNALFLIRASTSITTSDGTAMHLVNGAQASNIYFVSGGSAILGDTSTFIGNLFARNDVIVRSNAIVKGRLFSKDGTVDLSATLVNPSGSADLSLTMSANSAGVPIGNDVIYTLSVKNSGPDAANSVIVWDGLPQAFTFVSATASKGSFAGSEWNVGSLAKDETATLTIRMTVPVGTAETSFKNTAEVKSSGSPDPDSTPMNNAMTEDDIVSASVLVLPAVVAPPVVTPPNFSPTAEQQAATSIDADRQIAPTTGMVSCSVGSIIRGMSLSAVYYCGADGKRYVFPDVKTFNTWYPDFSSVIKISDATLATIPLGGVVRYKPGVKLVKIVSDPRVYAVAANGTLRWITSELIAATLYGAEWSKQVQDIPDSLFVNYVIGADITSQ